MPKNPQSSPRVRGRKRRSSSRRYSSPPLEFAQLESRQLLAPLAADDFFSGIGNTMLQMRVDSSFEDIPSVKLNGSLFDNDIDVGFLENYDTNSSHGAEIVVESDGSFTYFATPDVTDVFDTFTYTISDGMESSSATVTIKLTARVWYFDSSAPEGGTGTSHAPIDRLDRLDPDFQYDIDSTGDHLYFRAGTYDSRTIFALEDKQSIVGEGVEFRIGNKTIYEAGDSPVLPSIVTIFGDNTFKGFQTPGLWPGDGTQILSHLTITQNPIQLSGPDVKVLSIDSVHLSGTGEFGINLERTSCQLTVTNSFFDDLDIGINVELREYNSITIKNNQFENITRAGVRIEGGYGNYSDTPFDAEISDNNISLISDPNRSRYFVSHGIRVMTDLIRTTEPAPLMVGNHISTTGRTFGIVVDGAPSLTPETPLDNQFDGTSVDYVFAGVHFDDTYFPEWNFTGNFRLVGASGNVRIGRLTSIQDQFSPAKGNGIEIQGHVREHLNMTIDELVINYVRQEPYSGTAALNTRFVDLTLGDGKITSSFTPLKMEYGNLDLRFTHLESTSPGMAATISHFGGRVKFEGPTQLPMSGILFRTSHRAVVSFHSKVEGHSVAFGGRGGGQLTFHEEVRPVTVERSYVDFETAISITGASATFHKLVSLTEFGGIKAVATSHNGQYLHSELHFLGGLVIDANQSGLITDGTTLTIAGKYNVIRNNVSDQPSLQLRRTIVGEGGIRLNEVSVPHIVLDLVNPATGSSGSMTVDGVLKTNSLEVATETDIKVTSPDSVIRLHNEDSILRLFTNEQVDQGSFKFDGQVVANHPSSQLVFEPNNPVTAIFATLSSSSNQGIRLSNQGLDLTFKNLVSVGTPVAPVANGLLFSENSDVELVFADRLDLHTRLSGDTAENSAAITMRNTPSGLVIKDLEATSTNMDLIIAEMFGSLKIDDGNLQSTNAQLIDLLGGRSQIKLTQVASTSPAETAVEIENTTGYFHITGTNVLSNLGGDGSGGSIQNQTRFALRFVDTENVLLQNIDISNNSGDAIRATSVGNFRLLQSRIADNGTGNSHHALRMVDMNGFVAIDRSMLDNQGFANLSVLNRGDTGLDQFRFTRNHIESSRITGPTLTFSAYGKSNARYRITNNEIHNATGDMILARANGSADVQIDILDNLLNRFRRAVAIQQRGASNLKFNLQRNQIQGKEDGSSSYGIIAQAIPNSFGSGNLKGVVRDHRGSMGHLEHTDGIRIQLYGTKDGASGNIEIHANEIRNYDGFAAINVSVDGHDSNLEFKASSNLLENPLSGNRVGIRVANGFSTTPSSISIATITLKSNHSTTADLNQGAGYQLLQGNRSILNLTAPAGNSQIGQSFFNHDGGVTMSQGSTGNNNSNQNGKDVLVRGVINIIEERKL